MPEETNEPQPVFSFVVLNAQPTRTVADYWDDLYFARKSRQSHDRLAYLRILSSLQPALDLYD